MTKLQTIKYKGYKIEIHYDENDGGRKDMTNVGKIVTWKGRQLAGDEHIDDQTFYDAIDDHGTVYNWLRKEHGAVGPILDIDILDGPWTIVKCYEGATAGATFATAETLKETGAKPEDIEEQLKGDIAIYNEYLIGHVYGYVVKAPNGDVIDSLWGIYDEEFDQSRCDDDVTYCYLLRTAAEEIDGRIEMLAEQGTAEYTVSWKIEVTAATPLAAALEAHAAQIDANSTAHVFTAIGPDGHRTEIDLDNLEEA